MIWFSSDNHFYHEAIIQMCNRPFTTLGEMNEAMIYRWNNVITNNDEIFHLGDFSLGKSKETNDIVYRLNGKRIYFIRGNHDKHFDKLPETEKFVKLPPLFDFKINGIRYTLCHYPLSEWRGSHNEDKSIMLHGHCHGRLSVYGYRMDVGVDTNNFYPYSIEQINNIMKARVTDGNNN